MTITLGEKWAINQQLVGILSFGLVCPHSSGRIWATVGRIWIAPKLIIPINNYTTKLKYKYL